ncbi:MAG: ankyrin repeat domain-containing protein [Cytophagales bacterium]|nr:ankyrin repeat domain-containing protein [Cytophagales bacterium]
MKSTHLMKHSISLLLILISVPLFAQKDFGDYLDGLDRAGASSLAELSNELLKPEYKESLETNSSLIEAYIEEAQLWLFFSDADLEAWKTSIVYLLDLGYKMNDYDKEKGEPLFHLTSGIWTGLTTDSISNQYVLNTSLFELGGRSDVEVDGGSHLDWVLQEESLESPLLEAYMEDFKTWSLKRKRDWLFLFFEKDIDPVSEEMVTKLLSSEYFDVNLRSKNGKRNLFDTAVKAGNYTGASALIKNGFNVNIRCFDCNGETPLHVLVSLEDPSLDEEFVTDLMTQLLSNGADPDLRDMDTSTPIHLAIKSKNTQAFELFMQDEVEFTLNLVDDKGRNYVQYFEKYWTDNREDDFLIMLMNKTELKPRPTKEEIKKIKEDEKAKKAADKNAKKDKKKN